MKVRKFTAKSSRDALRQVREDLGPDAVILANRMVRGGVEILAMPAAEMEVHRAEANAAAAFAESNAPLDMSEDAVVMTRGRVSQDPIESIFEPRTAAAPVVAPRRLIAREEPAFAPAPAAVPASTVAPAPASVTASGPAPAVLRRRSVDNGGRLAREALPPVLQRSGFKPSSTSAPADRLELQSNSAAFWQESRAEGQQPLSSRAQLEALATANDPLMAALANEVKALGGMLNATRTAPPTQAAASPAASALANAPTVGNQAARLIQSMPQSIEASESNDPVATRGTMPGEEWVRSVMGELRSMRLMIEDQMGANTFTESARLSPVKGRVARQLSAAGFSTPMIRKVSARLPESCSDAEALAFACNALVNNLSVAGSEAELLDQGGVFALVGPTGAGKTTTAAKLAARFVVRHGAENLALLTTDGYRIGGQEQLRIYGKILGVAVHAVKDAEDLKRTLAELKNRKLVLIDTVGLSQRDRMVNEQHEMFANCGVPIKRLLLLNATCHGETLNDVIRAYKGEGLAGCIFSKLDEAVTLGATIDTAIRHRLRVFYAADGQRVPEDLQLADARKLVESALQRAPEQSNYSAVDLDFPMEITVNAATVQAAQAAQAAQATQANRGVIHG